MIALKDSSASKTISLEFARRRSSQAVFTRNLRKNGGDFDLLGDRTIEKLRKREALLARIAQPN
ncbi:MAG: hypothetical protein LBQ52_08590 [Helicobacteraceae bacterium]|jgi:hypothetical protein|nr:hypothetical protein [Helicobacteraceae bacterium]